MSIQLHYALLDTLIPYFHILSRLVVSCDSYFILLVFHPALHSGPAKGSTVLCFPLQMSASSSSESLDKCREELQELMQLQCLGTFSALGCGVLVCARVI